MQEAGPDIGWLIPMFANHVMALCDKVRHDSQIAARQEFDGNKSVQRRWFVLVCSEKLAGLNKS